jgi:hypothetical protein
MAVNLGLANRADSVQRAGICADPKRAGFASVPLIYRAHAWSLNLYGQRASHVERRLAAFAGSFAVYAAMPMIPGQLSAK